MIATSKIKMDLANPQRRINIDVMQDDRCSRELQISLYTGGIPYTPPQDCTALVRYHKTDGKTGLYDTLPDGSPACHIAGNVVTVTLAPQVCTVSGPVELVVSLIWGSAQLSSFAIGLHVHPQPGKNPRSEHYFSVTGFIPQPRKAQVGQYLMVSAVKDGRVTGLQTAFPAGNSTVVGSQGAPDYVVAEAIRVAKVAQNRQNGSTITFLACSDPHHSISHAHAAQIADSISHCGQAMAIIKDRIHLDFAAVLGDLIWDGGENKQAAQEAMAFVNQALAEGCAGIPNFRARGNHDCLTNGNAALTDSEIFGRIGIYNDGGEFDPGNRVGGYCYRDFSQHKLRIIVLNTSEDDAGSFVLSQAQLTWFQQALDLSAKGDGWASVVLSHHPLDWYGSGHAAVQALQNADHVLCCIHGHVHNFKVDTLSGTAIPRIAVPNVCFYRNNEYGNNQGPENSQGIEFGESQTYHKTANSADDTAFCVITLDRAAGKLYADHYGAGYGRVVNLDGTTVEKHSILCDLMGVSVPNVPAETAAGSSFATRITVEPGYTLKSICVTMGGQDVTGTVFDGSRICIDAVTGPLVITAEAVDPNAQPEVPDEPEVVAVNLIPTSIDTDGSTFNGVGYKTGYRLNSSGTTTALEGAIASGFIAYAGQSICISGSAASAPGTVGNYLNLYDSSFNRINAIGFDNLVSYGAAWQQSGTWQLTVDPDTLNNATVLEQLAAAAYIRCSLGAPESEAAFCLTLGGSTASGFTNQVPLSLDTDGTVYNGCGYITDHRLDPTGVVSLAGAVASGYVPYSGQVIRIYGTAEPAVGTDGNYFCMYGSDYSYINTIDFYNMAAYGAVWEQVEGKYMLTIDPAALTNIYVQEQLASAGYIRASFGALASAGDFVITLDQSI